MERPYKVLVMTMWFINLKSAVKTRNRTRNLGPLNSQLKESGNIY